MSTSELDAQIIVRQRNEIESLRARLEKAEAERDDWQKAAGEWSEVASAENVRKLKATVCNDALEEAASVAAIAVWAMYERSREDGNFVLSHDADRVADAIRALKDKS